MSLCCRSASSAAARAACQRGAARVRACRGKQASGGGFPASRGKRVGNLAGGPARTPAPNHEKHNNQPARPASAPIPTTTTLSLFHQVWSSLPRQPPPTPPSPTPRTHLHVPRQLRKVHPAGVLDQVVHGGPAEGRLKVQLLTLVGQLQPAAHRLRAGQQGQPQRPGPAS